MNVLQYINPETKRTEIMVAVEDIIAFYHDATGALYGNKDSFNIIIGRGQPSWCEVTEGCYNWMLEQWAEKQAK